MIEEFLGGLRRLGGAVVATRRDGGGCGIHFEGGGLQFVRLVRVPGPARVRLTACGTAPLDDDAMLGPVIHKPEAIARALTALLDRLGVRPADLRDDTLVLALPTYVLTTDTVDFPVHLSPRAARAWCERQAAMLLPGGHAPLPRARIGIAWAEPGSDRLRLYACHADLVDDRVAVLEMAGMRVQAIDATHAASRRVFRWAMSPGRDQADTHHALLQVGERDIDLSVYDGQTCRGDAREAFDAAGAHPEAMASMVRNVIERLPVVPHELHVAPGMLPPASVLALCDALAKVTSLPAMPFDPLARFDETGAAGRQRQTFLQRTTLTVASGLALRGLNLRGLPCE